MPRHLSEAHQSSGEDRRALHWVDRSDGSYRVPHTLSPQVDGDYRVLQTLSPEVRSLDETLQDGASIQLPLWQGPSADNAQLSLAPRHGPLGRMKLPGRLQQGYPLNHGPDSVRQKTPVLQPYHHAY